MSPTAPKTSIQIVPNVKHEPLDVKHEMKLELQGDFEDRPTDLSMEGPTDLSSNSSRHVNIICSPDPPIPPQRH